MEVPSLGFLVVRPSGLLRPREYHAFVRAGRLLVGPHIPIAVWRVLRASRFTKPWMRVRSVVDDEIDDDTDATLPAAMGEFHKIAERAIPPIDAIIVGDIVTVVLTR